MFRGLQACFAVLLTVSAVLADPDPDWLLPDCSQRAVFKAPKEDKGYFIVSVPLFPGEVKSNKYSWTYNSRGERIPSLCLLSTDEKRDFVLNAATMEPGEEYVLYCDRMVDLEEVSQNDREVMKRRYNGRGIEKADPLPLRIDFKPVSSKAYPDTWDRMIYTLREEMGDSDNFDSVFKQQFGIFSFADVSDENDRRGRRGRDNASRWLTRVSTHYVCREAGEYQFALNCDGSYFLLIDGVRAASWPGEHKAGRWMEGDPLTLSEGVHSVKIYGVTEDNFNLRLGIRRVKDVTYDGSRVEEDDFQPVAPIYLAAALEAEDVRIERIDKILHPLFSFNMGESYSFRTGPELPATMLNPRNPARIVFTPVKFFNLSEDWLVGSTESRWNISGEVTPWEFGRSYSHIFTNMDLFTVTMNARDKLGFTADYSKNVDLRNIVPVEYALNVAVEDLPAVCYPGEIVCPRLRLSGKSPVRTPLDAEWTVTKRSGEAVSFKRSFSPRSTAIFIDMIRTPVEDMSGLDWKITHAGAVLKSGVIRFETTPYRVLPVTVSGDRLIAANGEQVVLIPDQVSAKETRSITAVTDKVVYVDDMLGDSVCRDLAEEMGRKYGIERIISPSWNSKGDAYGPLLKLASVPAAVPAQGCTVVLSVGQQDVVISRDPSQFEKHLAALTDILIMKGHRLILVTPPPFGGEPDSVRPFAVAVRKVADARGLTTADLFTALSGERNRAKCFSGEGSMTLSEKGRKTVVKALSAAIRKR